jgi:hypothetical protein
VVPAAALPPALYTPDPGRDAVVSQPNRWDRMPHVPLVFVHLSDVHFQKRRVDGTYDLDVEIRNELEQDLREFVPTISNAVAGVIVTGDIAWAADPREFAAAEQWLAKICGLVHCRQEAVWTTPGNHDVDRCNVIEKSPLVQLVQGDLRASPARLEALQQDASASATLFAPLAAYNDFAGVYKCDFGPDRLVWQQDLPLNDGSILRLCGLNSTLTSCKMDDAGQRLVLGDMSHAILREPGVALATLCHHPPDWLLDHDPVTSLLNTRTSLQLFGHKHMQRIERVNNSLVLTAGAVHPDRKERAWEPRYNVLSCLIRTSGATRALEVIVHARVWSKASRKFTADTTDPLAGTPISLPLDAWTPPVITVLPPAADNGTAVGAPTAPRDVERQPAMDPARRLTYRFLTLPFHERIAIANSLALLRDEDKGVPDRVLFERFFRRARDQGKLERLWVEVEGRHGEQSEGPNPYMGQ